MTNPAQDNDDVIRDLARAALDDLRTKYWNAKKAVPQPSFDDLFDLRRAYEDAVVAYAGLEGRLLRDDILTKDIDLANFQRIRADMAAAKDIRETLDIAFKFIKMMVSLA